MGAFILLVAYYNIVDLGVAAMSEFITISLIIMLAAISPGPDFAMVVKNALLRNRRCGIFTALGVSCSLLIHSAYCILGLAIVISKSLILFSIIKYIGAAYLIYIGVKSLLAKHSVMQITEQTTNDTMNTYQGFMQGLLCNLLNPKAIMFILAFFTLIINPSSSWIEQLGFGIEIALIHFVWFSWLALMITHQRIRARLNTIQHYIGKVMGVALIGFGARIALLSHVVS
ncbi:MAG: lysine transporter LysE [Gammaproteobacteria bacterium]|jgi:RhtB (resistance to homoserine/threonine) family protein|nr:lysine transporter LysE [Gammaproteobacteria bacterium]